MICVLSYNVYMSVYMFNETKLKITIENVNFFYHGKGWYFSGDGNLINRFPSCKYD